MATAAFRGITFYSDATTGAALSRVVAPAVLPEMQVQPAAQGDGEFVRELGRKGGDVTFTATYRVAGAGSSKVTTHAALEALLLSISGLPRGALTVDGRSFGACVLISATAQAGQTVQFENGVTGELVPVAFNFRRSA